MTDNIQSKAHSARMTIPERVGDSAEVNYGNAPAPDYGPLARDRIPVRAMRDHLAFIPCAGRLGGARAAIDRLRWCTFG